MTVRDYIIIKPSGFLFLRSHAQHDNGASNEKNVRLLSDNRNLRSLYQHRLNIYASGASHTPHVCVKELAWDSNRLRTAVHQGSQRRF